MSHMARDTDENCRITDQEVLELGRAADAFTEQDVSSDKEEHMGEIRKIASDKQSGRIGDAAMSHPISLTPCSAIEHGGERL